MFNPQFDESLRQELEELFRPLPGVMSGDLFGYPAWYVNGILFACLEGDGVAFRLDRHAAGEWTPVSGVESFTPFGGKFRMPEWVQVFRDRFGSTEGAVAILESAYDYALRRAGDGLDSDLNGSASTILTAAV